jgi:hypothetical protein
MSYYVVASIIKAHHLYRDLCGERQKELHQVVWSLLFNKTIPELPRAVAPFVSGLLEEAEGELLRIAPKSGLRKHLIQLIDIQDIVYAQRCIKVVEK